MADLFVSLEGESFFKDFVRASFEAVPNEMAPIFECEVIVDEPRLDYAYKAYKQNIAQLVLQLYSEDPDHYKRSAALLQALHASGGVIGELKFVADLDDIECGFAPIHMRHADTVREMPFARFYEQYANELNEFILSYRCCASYDDEPRRYDLDYLHNICVFLSSETNHTVESLFMIFKSMMLR